MEVNTFISFMYQYGLLFLVLIVFIEYLSIPGFPAGLILPLSGIWAIKTGTPVIIVVLVSVATALVASWLLYFIGWYGGDVAIKKYIKRFPKQKSYVEDKICYLQKRGNFAVFFSKLVPVARTVIAIPAGALKINFWQYTIYSTLGILVWNSSFILLGYILGDGVLKMFA